MRWQLNVMTVVAKVVLMAALVFAGAAIVRNVTAALHAVTVGCTAGIEHLL